jgi:mRNA interferase MazF
MPAAAYSHGDVLLARLVFSDGRASKRRPVLVVYDFGDDDLLVLPITSHPVRVATDVLVLDWNSAGLRLPSTIRAEKLATIAKSCVVQKLGQLDSGDRLRVNGVLKTVFDQILS